MEQAIDKALKVLASGGVILYPTDTVWGLGCDATNAAAVAKIFAIKEREESKSLVLLMPSVSMILDYVSQPMLNLEGFLADFDRPTTVIYPKSKGIASNAVPDEGSVAIRLTSDVFCKKLLERFNKPIVSTSANISGTETPQFFGAVSEEIKSRVDYVVEFRQDETEIQQASRIIKLDENGSIMVIRA